MEEEFRGRLLLGRSEEEVLTLANAMIDESLASWGTKIYDRFQEITNNIYE